MLTFSVRILWATGSNWLLKRALIYAQLLYISLRSIKAHFSCELHLDGRSTPLTSLSKHEKTSVAKSFQRTSESRCRRKTPIRFK